MIVVTIGREGCISCGQCWGSCPQVFIEDPEDGKSSIIEYPSPDFTKME